METISALAALPAADTIHPSWFPPADHAPGAAKLSPALDHALGVVRDHAAAGEFEPQADVAVTAETLRAAYQRLLPPPEDGVRLLTLAEHIIILLAHTHGDEGSGEMADAMREAADRLDPRPVMVEAKALVDLYQASDTLATVLGARAVDCGRVEEEIQFLEGVLDAVEDLLMASGMLPGNEPNGHVIERTVAADLSADDVQFLVDQSHIVAPDGAPAARAAMLRRAARVLERQGKAATVQDEAA